MAMVSKAEAAYVAYLYQDGSDVVGIGSGALDLSALTEHTGAVAAPAINPSAEAINLGARDNDAAYYTGTFSMPNGFGSGDYSNASSGSGDFVSIGGFAVELLVPQSYISGTALGVSTAIWNGTTLAALGVIDGTYTWTWGSGAAADSFTLNIGEAPPAAVPEPTALALVATGICSLALKRRWRTLRTV